jgi:crotonobetainyl-CoA:carnitine CoA-transferase CaiB-like acyl-CoA transferase
VKGKRVRSVTPPFTLSRSPMTYRRPPPDLGADTEQVLSELGLTQGDIEALRQEGALGGGHDRAPAASKAG